MRRQPPRRAGFTFLELVIVMSVIATLASLGFVLWRKMKADADRNATMSLVSAVASAIAIYEPKMWVWEEPYASPTAVTKRAPMWNLKRAMGLPDQPAVPGGPKVFYSIDGEPTPPGPGATSPSAPYPGFPAWPPGITAADFDDGFNTFTASQRKDLVVSGYTGFYKMVRPPISTRFVNKRKQVIDSWGQPLRIAYAADTYGGSSFGVWSAGPDKKDNTGPGPDGIWDTRDDVSNDDITSWKGKDDYVK
jgi:prepilin-type N-terminal cleavage/methylation domain-containing protein